MADNHLPCWVDGKRLVLENVSVSCIPCNEIVARMNPYSAKEAPKSGTVTMKGDIYGSSPINRKYYGINGRAINKSVLEKLEFDGYSFVARKFVLDTNPN